MYTVQFEYSPFLYERLREMTQFAVCVCELHLVELSKVFVHTQGSIKAMGCEVDHCFATYTVLNFMLYNNSCYNDLLKAITLVNSQNSNVS